MSKSSAGQTIDSTIQQGRYYRWVVCITGTFLMGVNAGVINSFGVFFKPLATDFGWDRATTSAIQSALWVVAAIASILGGWLTDRFGPHRVLAVCAVLTGLGLVLTSQINALWQILLTYSLMTGAGLSSNFSIAGISTARWFTRGRGLALGIASAGIGLGNMIAVPSAASLIATYGWSKAYIVLGVVAFVIMAGGVLIVRRKPPEASLEDKVPRLVSGRPVPLTTVIRTRPLWILFGVFFMFSFNAQMINVHIVNYATDMGVTALLAATLVSVMGFSSASGRVLMGSASDRIGGLNTLTWACAGLAAGLSWLLFARELWALYLFAVVFGFSHGAEVPQQTALISKYYGLRAVLVSMAHSGALLGSSLGAWTAGKLFDVTQSYQLAFIIGIVAILTALTGVLVLGRMRGSSFSKS